MKKCELCEFPARSYCQSDDACLCWYCDAKVHGANFLVARHARSLLCQICQSLTHWKAIGSKLGRAVSICDRCANRANLREREEESEEANEDLSTEDTDGLPAEEEEEVDTDSQVVPWSSTTPPPAASSSSASASNSQESDDVNRSSSQRRYSRSELTTQAGGCDGHGEALSVDYGLSLRPLKGRRTETECPFQAGSRSVEGYRLS
ncbi:hypothetical protein MANES_12G079100v8 [Manihot esculenta]|uniref:Uncharacterized protein n=1 Tax=Manihot esculenta TaxID=3983 RepID=A0ACB7GPR0_MANES|nr:hypothetical protein MANES_12G079100v8 [Manihot esculenta]